MIESLRKQGNELTEEDKKFLGNQRLRKTFMKKEETQENISNQTATKNKKLIGSKYQITAKKNEEKEPKKEESKEIFSVFNILKHRAR